MSKHPKLALEVERETYKKLKIFKRRIDESNIYNY